MRHLNFSSLNIEAEVVDSLVADSEEDAGEGYIWRVGISNGRGAIGGDLVKKKHLEKL